MPTFQDDTLRFPVVERFTSINGEGTHAGRLAAFIRFRGCMLACSYCDTVWANRADAPAEMLGIRDIVSFVEASPASCVTLTGGEPLMQDGIDRCSRRCWPTLRVTWKSRPTARFRWNTSRPCGIGW